MSLTRLPTPPESSPPPPLILCADGGGSKVSVVIRARDGTEVRGVAGPCNVQSVGHGPAIQAILLATYRALAYLPRSHLPKGLIIPPLPDDPTSHRATANGHGASELRAPKPTFPSLPALSLPTTPLSSRPSSPGGSGSPSRPSLPPINCELFQYIWLGLAGISTTGDASALLPHVIRGLCIQGERVKITNDVNLLAAPALDIGVKHVVAVVCGTGTVGRTIRVSQPESGRGTPDSDLGPTKDRSIKSLPLEDVAVSRGWGYMLCDEGSAFWIGRLAIRLLLLINDRTASNAIHATGPPPLLPLHTDLLRYFGVQDPMALIELTSLTSWEGGIGEAVAQRNAKVANAARIILGWAFDETPTPPSPTASPVQNGGRSLPLPSAGDDPREQSRRQALYIAEKSIKPMIDLVLDLLGDGSVVKPETTALALGGGLWQSAGYRQLLLDGLEKEDVHFAEVRVVKDAAGEGARGLARVEFQDHE